MPSRKTTRAAKANAARMPSIPRELLDQIEKQGPMTAETIQQASMAFKKALIGKHPTNPTLTPATARVPS